MSNGSDICDGRADPCPTQILLTVSGVTNDLCSDCGDLNGMYTLDPQNNVLCGVYENNALHECGLGHIDYGAEAVGTGFTMHVWLELSGQPVTFRKTGVSNRGEIVTDYELVEELGDQCSFANAKITTIPLGYNLNTMEDSASCLPVMGCQPGTLSSLFAKPFVLSRGAPLPDTPRCPPRQGGGAGCMTGTCPTSESGFPVFSDYEELFPKYAPMIP